MAAGGGADPHTPSRRGVERIFCSICGRSWGVYLGKTPRMWNVRAGKVFCDRRTCALLGVLAEAKALGQAGSQVPSQNNSWTSRAPGAPRLPPLRPAIERTRCSNCGRVWAVYKGKLPHMWTLFANKIFCDRRACKAARLAARQGQAVSGGSRNADRYGTR